MVERAILTVGFDARQAKRGSREFVRSADEIKRSSVQVQRAANDNSRAFTEMRKNFLSFRNVIAAAGIGIAVRQFIRLADSAQMIENRLKLVTDSAEELARVQEDLFEVAQRTNQEFASTTDLYVRLAQASNELGTSEKQLLEFTEAVGQAITISGASAQSASGALLQLGQAIGAGIVRAEEFNSILEGTPRIAQAVADGLDEAGGSVARLRSLISEGEVTSREFFDALISQAPLLAEEFAQMDRTVGQAMTGLGNELLRFVGALDDVSGATGGLVDVIDLLGGVIAFAGDATTAISDFTGALQDVGVVGDFGTPVEAGAALGTAVREAIAGAIPEGVRDGFNEVDRNVTDFLVGGLEDIGAEIAEAFGSIDLVERFNAEREARAAANGELAAYNELLSENLNTKIEVVEVDEKLAKEQERVAAALADHIASQERENVILEAQVAGNAELATALQDRADAIDIINRIQTDKVQLDEAERQRILDLVRANRELNETLEEQAEARREAAKSAREAEREQKRQEREAERQRKEAEREAKRAAEEMERAIAPFRDAAKDAFKDVINGTKSVGDAFEDLAARITDILLDMALEEVLGSVLGTGGSPFSDLIGSIFGGLGGGGLTGGGVSPLTALPHGNPFHTGGMVGTGGGARRSVAPGTFVGAPRLHNGLRSDEFPAILQKGEQVLSRREVANQNSGPGTVNITNTFPNVRDTREIRTAANDATANMAAQLQSSMARKGFG